MASLSFHLLVDIPSLSLSHTQNPLFYHYLLVGLTVLVCRTLEYKCSAHTETDAASRALDELASQACFLNSPASDSGALTRYLVEMQLNMCGPLRPAVSSAQLSICTRSLANSCGFLIKSTW